MHIFFQIFLSQCYNVLVFILSDLGTERTVEEVGLKTQGRNNRFLVIS